MELKSQQLQSIQEELSEVKEQLDELHVRHEAIGEKAVLDEAKQSAEKQLGELLEHQNSLKVQYEQSDHSLKLQQHQHEDMQQKLSSAEDKVTFLQSQLEQLRSDKDAMEEAWKKAMQESQVAFQSQLDDLQVANEKKVEETNSSMEMMKENYEKEMQELQDRARQVSENAEMVTCHPLLA